MAGENRRVAAESMAHAQGLTDNLVKQGFELESQNTAQWVLRKKRRRGDHLVTIVITQPSMLRSPAPPVPTAPSTPPSVPPPAAPPAPSAPPAPPAPPATGPATWAPPQG